MGVTVDGNAIRPWGDHSAQRTSKSLRGLMRQTIDQIHVDRLTPLSRRLDQAQGLFDTLHPVHGLLHVGVEILHAEADPVEAEPRQGCRVLFR